MGSFPRLGDEALLDAPRHRLCPTPDPDLAVGGTDVGLDRVDAQGERVSDLLVAQSSANLPKHVELAAVEDTTIFGGGTLQHRLLQCHEERVDGDVVRDDPANAEDPRRGFQVTEVGTHEANDRSSTSQS